MGLVTSADQMILGGCGAYPLLGKQPELDAREAFLIVDALTEAADGKLRAQSFAFLHRT